MKIKKIVVTGLFNIFNYTVQLNTEEKITIIIGPNGSGKTVLLKMINGFFNSKYSIFYEIPFKEFYVFFDNNAYVLIKNNKEKNKINIIYHQNEKKLKHDIDNNFNKYEEYFIDRNKMIKELECQNYDSKITNYLWGNYDRNLKESIYYDFINTMSKKKKDPSWLKKMRAQVNVHFVSTDRLLTQCSSDKNKVYEMVPTISKYSSELADNIQKKLTESGSISMVLDRTFPIRLIQRERTHNLNEHEMHNKFLELDTKRKRLKEVGLSDDEDTNANLKDILLKGNDAEKTIITEVLSIYVEDTEKKLEIFDDILNKIELFKKIIDSRFKYKKILINKDSGFVFHSYDGHNIGEEIPLGSLSSGEQHELILFYELLFKIDENALILMDEPELSLHVGWQRQFLNDLQEVIKLIPLNVIITTHSPQIIGNRTDLEVRLKGDGYVKINK